jgi:biopolymer transport protein ExbD
MFSGINVTPLVDIMLVLLIIFMVTAKLIVSQSLPMDLPRAATGDQQQTVFAVAVDSVGKTTVDSKPADDRELLGLARSARAQDPELRAVIRADQTTDHGRIVRLMDLLRQAGIAKIAFGVDPTSLETVAN